MNKTWKIILAIMAVIIVIIGGFWLWLSHAGSTKDIQSVANQFQSDSSWTLTAEHIEPPRNVCIGDNPCPSVFRSWKVDHALTKSEFESILQKSGWDFPIDGDCDISTGMNGSGSTICSVQGTIMTYPVEIRIDGAANHPESTSIILEVNK